MQSIGIMYLNAANDSQLFSFQKNFFLFFLNGDQYVYSCKALKN